MRVKKNIAIGKEAWMELHKIRMRDNFRSIEAVVDSLVLKKDGVNNEIRDGRKG